MAQPLAPMAGASRLCVATHVVGDAAAQASHPNLGDILQSPREFGLAQARVIRHQERPGTAAAASSANFLQKPHSFDGDTIDLLFTSSAAHAVGQPVSISPSLTQSYTDTRGISPRAEPSTEHSCVSDQSMVVETMASHQIGMALGSPAHPPQTWQTSYDSEERPVFSPDLLEKKGHSVASSKQHKIPRWHLFGGFFGAKKHGGPGRDDFYQVQSDGGTVSDSNDERRVKSPRRGQTVTGRKDKAKVELKRTQTLPVPPTPKHADFQTRAETQENRLNVPYDGPRELTNNPGGGLLNVSIPSVQLERYSVMFGSVLQKRDTSSTSSSSNLLARRQATLDRLDTVSENLASKEKETRLREQLARPRRATSPQPSKSPGFSLFPNTPGGRPNVKDSERTPLFRSNTTPAGHSPSRHAFPEDFKNPNRGAGKNIDSSAIPLPTATNKTWNLPPNPRPTPRFTPETDPSQSISASPTSTLDSREQLSSETYEGKPKISTNPPEWQTIAQPKTITTSISGSTTSGSSYVSSQSSSPHSAKSIAISPKSTHPVQQRARAGTVASPIDTTLPRPPVRSTALTEEEEREARLKSAADLSIARQISVSRQQRELLLPITRKGARPAVNTSLSPLAAAAVQTNGQAGILLAPGPGKNIRVVTLDQEREKPVIKERKERTPTVVMVKGDMAERDQLELRQVRQRMWGEGDSARCSGEIIVGVEGHELGLAGLGNGAGLEVSRGGGGYHHSRERSQQAVVEVIGR